MSSPSPLNITQKFNENQYNIWYIIKNDDISLTSPNSIKDDDISGIPTQTVTYLSIKNSFFNFIPEAIIEVNDVDHTVINRIRDFNTRIQIIITKAGEGNVPPSLSLTFIIKRHELLKLTTESETIRIYADLDNSIPLNTLCEYATSCSLETDNELMENPYKIIRSILNQVGYKMYPVEKIDDKGNKIETKYSMPHTNELCHFITYPNMKAIDAVKYLLSYAVGENGVEPPAYLIHNLLDDKGYITTLENLWKSETINLQPTLTKIPFSISEPILPGRDFVAREVKFDSELGGIENAKTFFNYRFFEYDQTERTWEKYNINKMSMNDMLTRGIDNSIETSIYMDGLKEDIEQAKYYGYSPHNHVELYDKMRNLELSSSAIGFTINGDLRLDIGQIITIDEKGSNNSKIEQFGGRWMITSIKHAFRNKEYETSVFCSRRFYMKKKNIFS